MATTKREGFVAKKWDPCDDDNSNRLPRKDLAAVPKNARRQNPQFLERHDVLKIAVESCFDKTGRQGVPIEGL